jgi:hypothetical protein
MGFTNSSSCNAPHDVRKRSAANMFKFEIFFSFFVFFLMWVGSGRRRINCYIMWIIASAGLSKESLSIKQNIESFSNDFSYKSVEKEVKDYKQKG